MAITQQHICWFTSLTYDFPLLQIVVTEGVY